MPTCPGRAGRRTGAASSVTARAASRTPVIAAAGAAGGGRSSWSPSPTWTPARSRPTRSCPAASTPTATRGVAGWSTSLPGYANSPPPSARSWTRPTCLRCGWTGSGGPTCPQRSGTSWRPTPSLRGRSRPLAAGAGPIHRRRPPSTRPHRLARLCALADLLLLDLVVEARRQGAGFGWAIRYEVPGSPVPPGMPGWCRDLPEALARTDVADALTGLAERGLTAPARLLRPDSPRPPGAPAVDVDQLERRVLADCVDPADGDELPGAQALWRDGRWWHTTLRPGEPVETLAEQPTGAGGPQGAGAVCAVATNRPTRPGWANPSTGGPARTAGRTTGCAPATAGSAAGPPKPTARTAVVPACARRRCAASPAATPTACTRPCLSPSPTCGTGWCT